jgi:hypothetical protein
VLEGASVGETSFVGNRAGSVKLQAHQTAGLSQEILRKDEGFMKFGINKMDLNFVIIFFLNFKRLFR